MAMIVTPTIRGLVERMRELERMGLTNTPLYARVVAMLNRQLMNEFRTLPQ